MGPRSPFPLLHQGHGLALLRGLRGRQALGGQRAGRQNGSARLRLLVANLHVPGAVGGRIVNGRGGAVVVVARARGWHHILSAGRDHRGGTIALRLVDVAQHVTRPVVLGRVEALRHLEGLGPVGEILGRAGIAGGQGHSGLADQLPDLLPGGHRRRHAGRGQPGRCGGRPLRLAAFGGNPLQQHPRLEFRGTEVVVLLGGGAGQPFSLVVIMPTEHRLGLFQEQPGKLVAIALAFAPAFLRVGQLVGGGNQGLDPGRVVVVGAIGDRQRLGLLDLGRRRGDVAHGQGASGRQQEPVALQAVRVRLEAVCGRGVLPDCTFQVESVRLGRQGCGHGRVDVGKAEHSLRTRACRIGRLHASCGERIQRPAGLRIATRDLDFAVQLQAEFLRCVAHIEHAVRHLE